MVGWLVLVGCLAEAASSKDRFDQNLSLLFAAWLWLLKCMRACVDAFAHCSLHVATLVSQKKRRIP